jgi:beta-1,2-mannobiose phosphorylase / 1,2-beta-oligomannan phosphorylase
LFVYYGGADKVCCLAKANIDALVDYILQND